MLDRHSLRSKTEALHTAVCDVVVQVWAMDKFDDETDASIVYIHTVKEACTPALGTPLQPGITIDVALEEGQTLWGMTRYNALVGISTRKQ